NPMKRLILRAVAASTLIVATAVPAILAQNTAMAGSATNAPEFALTVFPLTSDEIGFSNSWGNARSGGRSHTGTDIMGPRGTPVVAATDGIVTKLGKHRLSGYFIRLDHGDGWATTYMHLNNDTIGTDDGKGGPWTAFFATLMEGDEVKAGQIIGYVGDSGNAEGTRPHTHFEVKYDGRKKNPYTYLRDAFEREERCNMPVGKPL
ncbi:MAG: M23 family metallopeptidase, partial [Actinomycetota bacterium]